MPPKLPPIPSPRQWLPRLFSYQPTASLHTTQAYNSVKFPSSGASTLLDNEARSANPLAPTRYSRNSYGNPSSDNPLKPNEALRRVLNNNQTAFRQSSKASRNQEDNYERFKDRTITASYASQMPRRWRTGDTYAPHDLSPEETKKFRRAKRNIDVDILDTLGMNPVDEYRNFAVISEFITPTGRIKHSKESGLRPVNQRKMAKAVRRAIGLGLYPSVHRHPEILNTAFRNLPQTIAGKSTPGGY